MHWKIHLCMLNKHIENVDHVPQNQEDMIKMRIH